MATRSVAVGAATAYKTIADSLNEALKGADMSKGAAENATDVVSYNIILQITSDLFAMFFMCNKMFPKDQQLG